MSSHCVVDHSKCTRDGVCVLSCPIGLLRTGADGHPEPVPHAEQRCVRCGHCVSVCPKGALSLDGVSPEGLISLKKDWRPSPEQAEQFLKGRRSIRAFRPQPVPRDEIERMLTTATYAPSGHNSQPVSWTVVYERDDVQRIARATVDWMRRAVADKSPMAAALGMDTLVADWDAGKDSICRSAPHLVIARAPEKLPTAALSCALATTYLDLAAVSRGAGTCWAGFVFVGAGLSPEVAAALRLPEGQKAFGISMLGYPKFEYRRIPARNPPRIQWQSAAG